MGAKESLITKLEKGRAEFAYECVKQAITALDNKKQKEYRSYVRKLPQMILSNGLGQTLAFVYAKKEGGNAYDIIYKQLTDYLKSDVSSRIKMPNNQNELIEWVISLNSYEYRYVTEELLALFMWIRKFAEGMIKVEEEGE
ncbi:MAG: type III-B CRISPR module-associated protein Cmr5 [Caldimicrobium sp.]|nr:type III-B CRISPR module-associated protein Cmr5 [Caldimicrobium sp.]MDW8182535.1 type III-B CRISPR module-associated protein Cmr5 [Caldimicrobium sp.]